MTSRITTVIPVALLSVGLAFGLTACADQSDSTTTQTATATATTTSAPEAAPTTVMGLPTFEPGTPADPAYRTRGSVDAPVVVTEFLDLRCPHCADWAQHMDEVIGQETAAGNIRVDYQVLGLLGPDSERAAIAAHAAGLQGKLPEFLSEAFKRFPTESKPTWQEDELVDIAKTIGVEDIDKFAADMHSDALRDRVMSDTMAARQGGLTGVPTILINGVERTFNSQEDFLAGIEDAKQQAAK